MYVVMYECIYVVCMYCMYMGIVIFFNKCLYYKKCFLVPKGIEYKYIRDLCPC